MAKQLTEKDIIKLGKEAGESLRETGIDVDENAYETALGVVEYEEGVKEYFEAKGCKSVEMMASGFADFIE